MDPKYAQRSMWPRVLRVLASIGILAGVLYLVMSLTMFAE